MTIAFHSPPGPDGAPAAEPVVVRCAEGTSLFDAGGQARAGIDTACVGKGTCGLCRVKVLDGADGLSPYTDEELRHLGNLYHLTKLRLACRATVRRGEVAVQVVRKKRGR
ncbi:MAG: 2Fe-2S iron-sulfur cluster-binding protein [Kofleriaceae bacterium]